MRLSDFFWGASIVRQPKAETIKEIKKIETQEASVRLRKLISKFEPDLPDLEVEPDQPEDEDRDVNKS